MTVRVERTFELEAPPERVWEFIADPAKRARPISVVESFDVHDDTRATWHISLPIPFVTQTIAVETEDTVREPPEHVEFEGRSRVMRVVGKHDLEPLDGGGTRLANRFTVEGKMPGVERFFKRNLDDELDNLEAAIRDEVGVEA